jgi:selenocysteine-specific elongation factor
VRTVVVGTAGHIDHGKTTLLRALTGIDADRLPEERRRAMTIDVGFAHLELADGSVLDFVDVPGHDRLVGNMLVGAGEIDAALVVVAADDGPRAQTLEHLELLDAMGVHLAVAVLTKADLLADDRDRLDQRIEEVHRLLSRTALASAPVVAVSAATGEGLDDVRETLLALRDRVLAEGPPSGGTDRAGWPRLAVDRVFAVRGRGAVVTGTLRGGAIRAGDIVRTEPGPGEARVREVQVHGHPVDASDGGRTALNLAGVEAAGLRRGLVVTTDPGVVATDRLLVALRRPPDLAARPTRDRSATWSPTTSGLRLHLGTEQADAMIDRRGLARTTPETFPWGEAIVRLRLDRAVAAAPGDRFVLRHPSPGRTVAGGRVLDPRPPAGPSRRRSTPERLAAVASAEAGAPGAIALLDLHGSLPVARWQAIGGPTDDPRVVVVGPLVVARDVLDALVAAILATVTDHHDQAPDSAGVPLASLRTAAALDLRRRATTPPPDASGAATAILAGLVSTGRLARDDDRIRDPRRAAGPPDALTAAMDRLEAALSVATPPAFADAVSAADCPVEGVRRLETSGRIVRLSTDLAYSASAYRALGRRALELAGHGPLTPAAFRDATGTSRKYVMALLEDLDRRGVLVRTPAGHVPGPRAAILDDEPAAGRTPSG